MIIENFPGQHIYGVAITAHELAAFLLTLPAEAIVSSVLGDEIEASYNAEIGYVEIENVSEEDARFYESKEL